MKKVCEKAGLFFITKYIITQKPAKNHKLSYCYRKKSKQDKNSLKLINREKTKQYWQFWQKTSLFFAEEKTERGKKPKIKHSSWFVGVFSKISLSFSKELTFKF